MTTKKLLIAVLLAIGILAAGVLLFLAGDHDEETNPSGSTHPAAFSLTVLVVRSI
jgi:hypothetical protein